MDAAITNASAAAIFIPGPNLDIPAGETKSWAGITVADLDGNTVLKDYVVAGDATVSVTPGTEDAAEATQGALNNAALPIYTFANLPTGYDGRIVWCSDGRKTGEGATAGTGVPAYYNVSTTTWKVFYDDSDLAV